MQVLLRRDVEKLGKIGDVVDVKAGYARNYLLPRGFAMPVTPTNLARIEKEKKVEVQRREEVRQQLTELSKKLEAASFTVTSKANEDGALFGSVNAETIAAAMVQEGYAVDGKMIDLPEPIKQLGVYDIKVRMSPELEVVCKLWVVNE
jgi:large subunit ribosomal protein L9